LEQSFIFKYLKWPGHEADHSPPSSAEVMNEWIVPPLLNTSWHGA